ncbi:MAG: GntR family transcriptional regulator [Alphaproteobacteria bacterium]|nr:GntR family transcriptional regulator [Alphaproteobacteria bacterium]
MTFKTKQDQVADILRERIIAGEYERGAKLKQADIAGELGVSITPVREALHILEAEGYVVGVSHKGLLVPKLVPEQLREIYELRVALERELTRHAVANVTIGGLAHLKDLQRTVDRANAGRDLLARRIANYRFHFALYEFAGRPQALQFVRVLWAKYPFVHQERGSRGDGRMVEEHERLLVEIERRDEEGAAIAMVRHISNGWENFLSAMATAPAAARDEPAVALSR